MYPVKTNAPVEAQKRGTTSAREISVIETVTVIGAGTTTDPIRHLKQYWSIDGEKLAEHDTMADCD